MKIAVDTPKVDTKYRDGKSYWRLLQVKIMKISVDTREEDTSEDDDGNNLNSSTSIS